MEQSTGNENLESKPSDIDFHDLETLLQQGLGNNELKVIDHQTKYLLPAGENYSSLVVKLDATICRKDDAEKEILHLVAKARIPNDEYLDSWILGFKKEVFAYTELLPIYKDIEVEAGIPENELIDIIPKYTGHRNSFKNNSEIDKDSLILMENMKMKGYYNCDRHTGLDLEHATIAFTSLAKYHALGIAMMQKRPSFAQIAMRISETKFVDQSVVEAYDTVRKAFHKYSSLAVYIDLIEASITYMIDKLFSQEIRPVRLWDAISHGDFWTNNILFHKNDQNRVDDVKFVDWALYFRISVLADLPYFLCTSIQRTVLDDHFDDLLNLYYDTFIRTLERVGCDTTMFTRKSFDAELKKQAINELAMCALAIKFIHYQVEKKDEENRQLHKNVFESENDNYEVSLLRIIEIYQRRKWL
ncbi:uncharacterized protein LOC131669047 [Phymastichus coffea]|uniref:uncharacterized protein LOC131669047 n=1 Tax=Phymastichus coffea TaxID=108790 RepID=UPI00273B0E36|nr:uncharacterized protein LOC131669047 [Phymastichus coffea]XP_058799602.1 uncharacterized protein LOC131669047 [Phymastichus coffea]